MSKPTEQKSLITALGAGFALSLSLAPLAQASENPFGAKFFAAGTQVAAEHSCGAEGKCALGVGIELEQAHSGIGGCGGRVCRPRVDGGGRGGKLQLGEGKGHACTDALHVSGTGLGQPSACLPAYNPLHSQRWW